MFVSSFSRVQFTKELSLIRSSWPLVVFYDRQIRFSIKNYRRWIVFRKLFTLSIIAEWVWSFLGFEPDEISLRNWCVKIVLCDLKVREISILSGRIIVPGLSQTKLNLKIKRNLHSVMVNELGQLTGACDFDSGYLILLSLPQTMLSFDFPRVSYQFGFVSN